MPAAQTISGVDFWFEIPDRWMQGGHPLWRCENGHVSIRFLKSEESGDLCLECESRVQMTFPEDKDGDTLGAEIFALRAKSRQELLEVQRKLVDCENKIHAIEHPQS